MHSSMVFWLSLLEGCFMKCEKSVSYTISHQSVLNNITTRLAYKDRCHLPHPIFCKCTIFEMCVINAIV